MNLCCPLVAQAQLMQVNQAWAPADIGVGENKSFCSLFNDTPLPRSASNRRRYDGDFHGGGRAGTNELSRPSGLRIAVPHRDADDRYFWFDLHLLLGAVRASKLKQLGREPTNTAIGPLPSGSRGFFIVWCLRRDRMVVVDCVNAWVIEYGSCRV
jgi:hypothetical protein